MLFKCLVQFTGRPEVIIQDLGMPANVLISPWRTSHKLPGTWQPQFSRNFHTAKIGKPCILLRHFLVKQNV